MEKPLIEDVKAFKPKGYDKAFLTREEANEYVFKAELQKRVLSNLLDYVCTKEESQMNYEEDIYVVTLKSDNKSEEVEINGETALGITECSLDFDNFNIVFCMLVSVGGEFSEKYTVTEFTKTFSYKIDEIERADVYYGEYSNTCEITFKTGEQMIIWQEEPGE